MMKSFQKHLEESKVSYFEHLKFALYAGACLLYAGIASLIHAFLPNLFKGTAAFIVIKLYNDRLVDHPNPVYQEYLKNETDNKRHN